MARLLVWLLLTASALYADGGAVVLHRESPPSAVTVFASPMPPRVGDIDLSVLVQSSDTLEAVLDADVHLEFMKSGSRMQVQATRSQARNKLLYSASVHLNEPGEWRYTVSISNRTSASTPIIMSGNLIVTAEQPKLAAYWSYLAFPFLCLAILVLHQWLRLRSSLAAVSQGFPRY